MPRTKSVWKSETTLKRLQAKERRQLAARQKHQLAMARRGRRAEKIYHKTGKWPKWYT